MLADEGIAQTREPAGLFRRQPLQMPANHFDEHQLAQFGQHAFAAGALFRRFHHRETEKLTEPAFICLLRVAGLDHRRQVLKQRIERLGIAGEVAADELGRNRPVAAIVEKERQLTAASNVERRRGDGIGAHAGTARQGMRIGFGEDDDFAGFERDRLFPENGGEAATFSDHMIRDEMPGTRQDLPQNHLPRRRLGDPRCLGHNVEERRARQPYRFSAHRKACRHPWVPLAGRLVIPPGRSARCLINPGRGVKSCRRQIIRGRSRLA
jgi:hypothetical protein